MAAKDLWAVPLAPPTTATRSGSNRLPTNRRLEQVPIVRGELVNARSEQRLHALRSSLGGRTQRIRPPHQCPRVKRPDAHPLRCLRRAVAIVHHRNARPASDGGNLRASGGA